ncbi:hypothetical protein SAMN02745225_01802 [Ferrithrix thermotolerans DSM 19514]|uniref:Uncharacterized protein n=2 Tax=Ferrithrix TaxID=643949 RepID=A0A1M4WVT9_9ACTN|nr:hypothetical protein SAMN02745225_01802 [Ferrithrix thermotolerans DSM 19514]
MYATLVFTSEVINIVEHMFYNIEMSSSSQTLKKTISKDDFVYKDRSVLKLPFASTSLRRGDTVVVRGSEGSGVLSFLCDLLDAIGSDVNWRVGVNLRDLGVKGLLQGSRYTAEMFFVNCATDVAPRCIHTLLDAFELVVIDGSFSTQVATRLSAKARQRNAILLVLERSYLYTSRTVQNGWMGKADLVVTALSSGFQINQSQTLESVVRKSPLLKVRSHGVDSIGTLARVS